MISSHRQSRTLKQDPKKVNGFDKEHFSKEPVMEKNSNGLYTVEDEDTDYSKTTYIVNTAFSDTHQEWRGPEVEQSAITVSNKIPPLEQRWRTSRAIDVLWKKISSDYGSEISYKCINSFWSVDVHAWWYIWTRA